MKITFSYLPESIGQLSKMERIYLSKCTGLRSLSQLPSTTSWVKVDGCTSLETFPNGFKSHNLYTSLSLANCHELADRSDMFFNVLKMVLTVHQVSLSLSLSLSLYIYICQF